MVTKVQFRQSYWTKLVRTRMAINREGMSTVIQLAKIGRAHAARYAPYLTGKTARSIKYHVYGKGTGSSAIIEIEPKRLVNNNFDLVKWMHVTNGRHLSRNPHNRNEGGVGKHIRSGNPRFMYNSKKYLNTIKKRVAKGNFNKINIK